MSIDPNNPQSSVSTPQANASLDDILSSLENQITTQSTSLHPADVTQENKTTPSSSDETKAPITEEIQPTIPFTGLEVSDARVTLPSAEEKKPDVSRPEKRMETVPFSVEEKHIEVPVISVPIPIDTTSADLAEPAHFSSLPNTKKTLPSAIAQTTTNAHEEKKSWFSFPSFLTSKFAAAALAFFILLGGSVAAYVAMGQPLGSIDPRQKAFCTDAENCGGGTRTPPDGGGSGIPNGPSSGCCSNNTECASWFGSGSTCTNSNGACGSGKQCQGGSPGGGACTETCRATDCGRSICGGKQICNGGCDLGQTGCDNDGVCESNRNENTSNCPNDCKTTGPTGNPGTVDASKCYPGGLTSKACQSGNTIGSACTGFDGTCFAGDKAPNGQFYCACVPKGALDNGMSCTADSNCKSNYCDPFINKCAYSVVTPCPSNECSEDPLSGGTFCTGAKYCCPAGSVVTAGMCIANNQPSPTPNGSIGQGSCPSDKPVVCNCPIGTVCQPNGGQAPYVNENGVYCYPQNTTFTCVNTGSHNPSVDSSAALGGTCDNTTGNRGACAQQGCSAGYQLMCNSSTKKWVCTKTDACAATTATGNVSPGQSCNGLKQLSAGEAGKGAFVGCSGTLNCFCTSVEGRLTGNVSCAPDLEKDSCGAPGASTPKPTSNSPVTNPSNPPTGSSPPSTNPPSTNPPASYVCNSTCTGGSQCPSGLVCSNGKCRNSQCVNSATCTCSSIPPMVCLNITKDIDSPKLGDQVRFTCGAVATATSYEFRYKIDEGTVQVLNTISTTSNISTPITIISGGRYRVQCRPCVGNSCTAWETL